ncbi:MAG TPA: (d)CMP kinase [Desulfobacteria bacterium]|nr:(d)CMP kinase [Desulfobacteria bacterium]
MEKLTIAIDGPAGAGKSTVAKRVAAALGLLYIDTGAMYRALTWKALAQEIDFADTARLTDLAANTEISLAVSEHNAITVWCDGRNVTEEIRTPIVSANVSKVAAIPGVRQRMVALQQAIAAQGRVVMDGRDIGTTVLPDADCKFFLTASLTQRAYRRWIELGDKGYQVDLKDLEQEISKRDQQDETRATAPLRVAPGAVVIHTDDLTIEQVVATILDVCASTTGVQD